MVNNNNNNKNNDNNVMKILKKIYKIKYIKDFHSTLVFFFSLRNYTNTPNFLLSPIDNSYGCKQTDNDDNSSYYLH